MLASNFEKEYKEKIKQVKDVETLVMDNDRLINELYQLKQTLTEIKGIANKVLLNTHDLEQFKDADTLFGALLEIHKKISEVE